MTMMIPRTIQERERERRAEGWDARIVLFVLFCFVWADACVYIYCLACHGMLRQRRCSSMQSRACVCVCVCVYTRAGGQVQGNESIRCLLFVQSKVVNRRETCNLLCNLTREDTMR